MMAPNKRTALVVAGLAVSTLLFAKTARAQDVSFLPAQNFPAGYQPRSVAVADFNGDGVQDLAVSFSGDHFTRPGGVAVLLGNGDGTFQTAHHLEVGGRPSSVVVGDFNGDGWLDMAVAVLNSSVAVLLGNGDGSFQDGRLFAAGYAPASVAVGDFNGDGCRTWPWRFSAAFQCFWGMVMEASRTRRPLPPQVLKTLR